MTRTGNTAIICAIFGALLAALVVPQAGAARFKVGFVYDGELAGQGAWVRRHEAGRLELEKTLGGAIKTRYVELSDEGPGIDKVLRKLAKRHDLIFITSYGGGDGLILEAARMFPEARFEVGAGTQQAANLGNYRARWYQGRYIAGRVAGSVSNSGIIGYVAAAPVPEVVRGINAFTLGLRSVRFDARVRIRWVNAWSDPPRSGALADALIDEGADIIVHHTDSAAPLEAAQRRGVYGFGQTADYRELAPRAQLMALVTNWGPYYVRRVRAAMDGAWAPRASWPGLAEDAVLIRSWNEEVVPPDVIADAGAVERALRAGRLHPFAGPLRDQQGRLVVDFGEALDDAALLAMDWFVEGVEGEIPARQE